MKCPRCNHILVEDTIGKIEWNKSGLYCVNCQWPYWGGEDELTRKAKEDGIVGE